MNSKDISLRDANFPPELKISASTPSLVIPDFYNHCLLSLSRRRDAFGLEAQQEAIGKYGIAGRVWEAAYLVVAYLNPPPGWEIDPPFLNGLHGRAPWTVLELGSGSGMLASCLAEVLNPAYDRVIATDLPEVCDLLERNLCEQSPASKRPPHVFVKPLAWGNKGHVKLIAEEFIGDLHNQGTRPLTHVICSDLVYFPSLLAPLLRTLIHISSPPICTDDLSIIISYKPRSLTKEAIFWSAFGLWFDFKPVIFKDKNAKSPSPWRRFGSTFGESMFILHAERRKASLLWRVPNNDDDLLGGVGAQGTEFKKSDATFESLLLLSVDLEDELK